MLSGKEQRGTLVLFTSVCSVLDLLRKMKKSGEVESGDSGGVESVDGRECSVEWW